MRNQCLKYSSAHYAAGLSRVENCSSSSKIPIPMGRPFSFTIAAEQIAIGNTFGTKFSKFGATPSNTFKSPLDLLLSNQLRCTPEAQSLCDREKRANLTKLHSYSYLLILSQTAKQTIQPIRSRTLQSGCGKGTIARRHSERWSESRVLLQDISALAERPTFRR